MNDESPEAWRVHTINDSAPTIYAELLPPPAILCPGFSPLESILSNLRGQPSIVKLAGRLASATKWES